jgi:hypothetical protein
MAKSTKHFESRLNSLFISPEKYKQHPLYDTISHILFQQDPMRLNFGENTGEYYLEAHAIGSKLNKCKNEQDVVIVVDTVLSDWFSKEWFYAKPAVTKEEQLMKMSSAIWKTKHRSVKEQ